MSRRAKSFIIIGLVYLLAIIIGSLIFLNLSNLSLWLRVLVADISATLFIWVMSLILKNASLYDPYWSVIPPAILILIGIYLNISLTLPIFLLYVPILLWSIRLTYNWASLWTGFNEVDWRYEKIRKSAPKLYPLSNLLGIQLFPTLIVYIQLLAAILFISSNPELNPLMILGSLMMTLAVLIQLISDEQMKAFKKKNQGQNLCIEEGLWKYSRHPNYFGEIMVWWGLYLLYLSHAKTMDLYSLAPILMTSLFLFISIPWMEKKIISTRPNYLEYQQRVSMLIPFFRKETVDVKTKNA
jgi:steroid 5-alpha reductase family enzyme